MPGPAPDPNARRRNKKRVDMVLPSGGRKGRIPAFPITSDGVRVPATWAELWRLPQSAAWEKLSLHRPVARYALLLVRAEEPDATASLLNEVRQMEDRLGLTPMAMLRLHWEMSSDEVMEKRAAKQVDTASTDSRRERLRIVGA